MTFQSPRDPDAERVRRSARRVGVTVGIASAAVLALIAFITVSGVVLLSRGETEYGGPGRDGHAPWRERTIELGDVIGMLMTVSLVGVVALAVIAWFAARRAARPMAEALRVQRAFVADASHELRTPLTTLNSRIQLAEHRSERGGDVAGALAEMRRDALAMNAVLDDLLVAAQSVNGRVDPDARAELAAVIEQARAVIGPQASARKVRIDVTAADNLVVRAEPAAVSRAVVALLDNAVRHSPEGAAVGVHARAGSGGMAEIRIADHGSGIAATDTERIFERFHRADNGDHRRGFGLGLALVRDIARRFDGEVLVESTSPSGTTFLLRLPLAT